MNSILKKPNIILEVGSVKTEMELHLLLQKELDLDREEDFIGNWDYFNDVIAGYVFPEKIIIKGWVHLKEVLPKDAEDLLDILRTNMDSQNSIPLNNPYRKVTTNIEFVED